MDFLNLARNAWEIGDFDTARMYYQKVSYGIYKEDQEVKDAFTAEVAQFAGEDPIYQQGIHLIQGYIAQQNKPVLQSEMTAYVKNRFGEQDAETLRYILYYAEVRKDIIRRKKGRSYLLALSQEQLDGTSTQIKNIYHQNEEQTDFLTLLEPFSEYQRRPDIVPDLFQMSLRQLHSKATEYKKHKWEMAIECLYRAREIDGQNNEWETIDNRLRLPLFLQQAGYFSEAKFEFYQIINNLDKFTEQEAGYHQHKQLYQSFLKHSYLSRIFDKVRLSFKREKLNEQAEIFANFSTEYQKLADEIGSELDKAIEIDREKTKNTNLNTPISQVAIKQQENKASSLYSQQVNRQKQENKDALNGCLFILVIIIALIIWLIV